MKIELIQLGRLTFLTGLVAFAVHAGLVMLIGGGISSPFAQIMHTTVGVLLGATGWALTRRLAGPAIQPPLSD